MEDNKDTGYFDDNGEKFEPNLISKPSLCTTCQKDDDHSEEIMCNMNRLDQKDENEFICYAYESKYKERTNEDKDNDIGEWNAKE